MADHDETHGTFGFVERWIDCGAGIMAKLTAVVLQASSAVIGKVDQGAAGAAAWPVTPVTATPTPYNVTCTLADTEYSQALPTNTRLFEFQARTEATLRYAFATGKVAASTAPFLTLKAGDYYCSPDLNQGASPSTLYVASPTAGTVCEILAWV